MIAVWKNKVILYRHALVGSGIITGALISLFLHPAFWIVLFACIIGTILIAISAIVTYTVNKYPENFKAEIGEVEELKLAKKVKDLGKPRSD